MALMGAGNLPVVDARRDAVLDVVPVDVIAGHIIAAANLLPASPPPYQSSRSAGEKRYPCQIILIHAVAGLKDSLPINMIASRTVSYFRKVHEQHQHLPASKNISRREPKTLTDLGPRTLPFHIHDMLDHRFPLALMAFWFRLLGNDKMKPKSRSLARVLRKINAIFPYYMHHTLGFEVGRSWNKSLGEYEPEGMDAEGYADTILEGVRRSLLKV